MGGASDSDAVEFKANSSNSSSGKLRLSIAEGKTNAYTIPDTHIAQKLLTNTYVYPDMVAPPRHIQTNKKLGNPMSAVR